MWILYNQRKLENKPYMKKKITTKILCVLDEHGAFSDEIQRIKAEYIINIILGEILKFGSLGVAFASVGAGQEYITAAYAILSTRTFAGGLHEDQEWKCIIHTAAFIGCSIVLAKQKQLGAAFPAVWVTLLVLFFKYAPIVSAQRGYYSVKQKYRMKCMSILGLISIAMLTVMNRKKLHILTGTAIMELIEYVILLKIRG